MTKSHNRRSASEARPRRLRDKTVYIGILLIGLFGVFLISILSEGQWQGAVIGFIIAITLLITYAGLKAYFGGVLTPWQRSLARVPLRFVGYTEDGRKKLTEAKGEPAVLAATLLCLAICVAILVGLSYWWY